MTGRHEPGSMAWGVLLAGGDGTRLQSLTAAIEGDLRPKQFCRILGEQSLLANARRRIAPLLDERRTIAVVTRKHEPYYASQLSDLPENAVLVQPENRGTGVAIAATILLLRELNDDAVVAFFPCDHHYGNEAAFLRAVEAGIRTAERNLERIVLLGAPARHPETEYGWIELEPAAAPLWELAPRRVRRLWEKPNQTAAQELLQRGCLWNMFVTIGRVSTFVEVLCAAAPEAMLLLTEGSMENDLGACYPSVPAVDFCRDVLVPQPERILVIPDQASRWTDLGTPGRVFETLERETITPRWLDSTNMAEVARAS